MTGQMKKLTGKCPVTDCYCEHCAPAKVIKSFYITDSLACSLVDWHCHIPQLNQLLIQLLPLTNTKQGTAPYQNKIQFRV